MQRLCPALTLCLAVVVIASCGGSGSDCNTGSQYKVGQESGNPKAFIGECEEVGGSSVIGEPGSAVEAWGHGCVQHFFGGTERESVIFEWKTAKWPNCDEFNPFPGRTYVIGGRLWNQYAYLSGCASRAPKVIGLPISEAETKSSSSPLTQQFRTQRGLVHTFTLEEATGQVISKPRLDCRLYKSK